MGVTIVTANHKLRWYCWCAHKSHL